VSTSPIAVRALLAGAAAALLGLGGSLLLARFDRQGLMRWPAAVTIALGIVAAVVAGVVVGG
jgi:hypothetical protein